MWKRLQFFFKTMSRQNVAIWQNDLCLSNRYPIVRCHFSKVTDSFPSEKFQDGTLIAHEVEIDLDEVLDMEGDPERRKFIASLLTGAKKSQDSVTVRNLRRISTLPRKVIQNYLFFPSEIHRGSPGESKDFIKKPSFI